MSRVRSFRRATLILGFAAILAMALPARAQAGSAVVAFNLKFLPGDSTLPAQTSPSITAGQDLEFVNADVTCMPCDHTLTHKPAAGKPVLFDTPGLAVGQQIMVPGVRLLVKGTYNFYCKIHPFMTGKLVVS